MMRAFLICAFGVQFLLGGESLQAADYDRWPSGLEQEAEDPYNSLSPEELEEVEESLSRPPQVRPDSQGQTKSESVADPQAAAASQDASSSGSAASSAPRAASSAASDSSKAPTSTYVMTADEVLVGTYRPGNWNYYLQADGRSYPMGGGVTGQLGWGFPLWGRYDEEDRSTDNWKYGYFRQSATFTQAAWVNYLELQWEVFPVSFVGISLGEGLGANVLNRSTLLDCDEVSCSGYYSQTHVAAYLVGGIRKFFGYLSGRLDYVLHTSIDKPFADHFANISGAERQDELLSVTSALGIKTSDLFTFGVTGSWAKYIKAQTERAFGYGFVSYTPVRSRFNYRLMAGVYKTNVEDLGVSAVLTLRWTGKKSLGWI